MVFLNCLICLCFFTLKFCEEDLLSLNCVCSFFLNKSAFHKEKFLSLMMTCMQIGQHFRDGYLHKDEFKIVYVAPMKVS